MSGPADDAAEFQPDALTAETVSAWLRRHPDFLQDNPEVLTFLTPPEFKRGERILDMQRFMLDKVQEELAGLRRREKQLLQAAEGNAAGQTKIHQAVAAIEDRMHVHDIHATILNIMGLDHRALTFRYNGRPERPTLNEGEPCMKLFG